MRRKRLRSDAANLRKVGLVFNTAGTIAVVDIGCGPADIILMYLGAARHDGGFSIHATDSSRDYTGPDGMAQANLAAAKQAGALRVSDFSVTNGDAFDGRLNATLGTPPNHFPLAIISHLFYHTTPEHLGRTLADVANNVLTPEGVAILIHTARKPNSFQYFRSKYGRTSATAGASDSPPMDVDDPPRAVEQACQTAGIPCHTVHYTNNYYFAPMDETYWETFKRPTQYRTIDDKPALDNLRQLYFIPQRRMWRRRPTAIHSAMPVAVWRPAQAISRSRASVRGGRNARCGGLERHRNRSQTCQGPQLVRQFFCKIAHGAKILFFSIVG